MIDILLELALLARPITNARVKGRGGIRGDLVVDSGVGALFGLDGSTGRLRSGLTSGPMSGLRSRLRSASTVVVVDSAGGRHRSRGSARGEDTIDGLFVGTVALEGCRTTHDLIKDPTIW